MDNMNWSGYSGQMFQFLYHKDKNGYSLMTVFSTGKIIVNEKLPCILIISHLLLIIIFGLHSLLNANCHVFVD